MESILDGARGGGGGGAQSAEKPNHFLYLTKFRVECCPLFKQHECRQHRPYTCFHWHFPNQRRRRPVREPDGSFNYSPDIYCEKYDEHTGNCPDGDSCPFLHRVSGDVERKYHPRYYKTAQCVHGADARGQCTRNGPHCAFAHSTADLRRVKQAQHEPNETPYAQSMNDNNGGGGGGGGGGRDKTSFFIEDPMWHSQDHVLSAYKTELCRKSARQCRQGYACPYYHSSKDRRRPPAKYKYMSTPCPAARNADGWDDSEMCEQGDACGYCHSRTEQQFHPEVYKSTVCKDMLEHGYCPRAVFCAFAHHDSELHVQRTPYLVQSSQASPVARAGSPTDQSPFASMMANGASSSRAISMLSGRGSSQRGEDLLSSSYPKAPLGFGSGGPLSPTARVRTHSLNMGMSRPNFGTISRPSFDPIGTSKGSGFGSITGALEALSIDLGTIDERDVSRQPYGGGKTMTSPIRIPGAESFHSSPMASYTDSLLQPSKFALNSPMAGAGHEAVLMEELSKTAEELQRQRDNAAILKEGMEQARQACETLRSESEVYRMMAEKAEAEKRQALMERDQAMQQLGVMRSRLGSDASTTRQPPNPAEQGPNFPSPWNAPPDNSQN